MTTREDIEARLIPSSSRHGQLQGSHSLISKLMDQKKLYENSQLAYIYKGVIKKNAIATRTGIKCMCCHKIYSMTRFEMHAGYNYHRGCDNIYLHNGYGKSLAALRDEPAPITPVPRNNASIRSSTSASTDDQNSTCDFCCHQRGEVLRCHTANCPAALHVECSLMQNLQDNQTPWYCEKCSCRVCGYALGQRRPHERYNENWATRPFPISCEQCEQCGDKYHTECLLQTRRLQYTSDRVWFCSSICKEIFEILRHLTNLTLDTGNDPLNFIIFKWSPELDVIFPFPGNPPPSDIDSKILEELVQARKTKQANKLFYALDLFRDSFEDANLHLRGSQRDLIWSILYNHRSAPSSCLDHNGFYTVLLEIDDKVVTVATLRIHGQKVAEIPFIATCSSHRGQGFCVRLMNGLEKILKLLDVERLVIQSPPQLVPMWTEKHNFLTVALDVKRSLLKSNLLKLDGTYLLYKNISLVEASEVD